MTLCSFFRRSVHLFSTLVDPVMYFALKLFRTDHVTISFHLKIRLYKINPTSSRQSQTEPLQHFMDQVIKRSNEIQIKISTNYAFLVKNTIKDQCEHISPYEQAKFNKG